MALNGQVCESPKIPNWLEKTLSTPSTRTCAPTSDSVHANAFSSAAMVKILASQRVKIRVFWNQFGISWLLETLITPDELSGAIWCFAVSFFIFIFIFFFTFSPQIPIYYFSCQGKCCHTVLQWISRDVSWTTKLHPISYIYDEIMSEFELIL